MTAIPVAVAILEGPFEPLAILAVHALNVPFLIVVDHLRNDDKDDGPEEAYGFLVPIEPGEGIDRLSHMLGETKPAIILCLEPDRLRLLQAWDDRLDGGCE
jgi:hypothetical protein